MESNASLILLSNQSRISNPSGKSNTLSRGDSNSTSSLVNGKGMEDLDDDFYSLKDNISGVGSSLNHKAEPTSSKRTSISLPVPVNQTNDFKKANTTADLMDGT